jgi:predicted kinase
LPDPALVLLIGPSGAGKSTFAAAHFRPTEIVSSDALRGMLTDDEGDQAASSDAFRLVGLIVNGRLNRRRMTVVDATNLYAPGRKGYRRAASRRGIPTIAICFDLPLSSYHARNAARPDRIVDVAVVEDQASRMPDVRDALQREGYHAVHLVSAVGVEIEVIRLGR